VSRRFGLKATLLQIRHHPTLRAFDTHVITRREGGEKRANEDEHKRTVHQPNFDHRHRLSKRPHKRPPYVPSGLFLRCWMFGVRCSMFPDWFPRSEFLAPRSIPPFPQVPAYSNRFNRGYGPALALQSCTHSAVVLTQTVVLRMRSCLVVPNRIWGGRSAFRAQAPRCRTLKNQSTEWLAVPASPIPLRFTNVQN